MCNIIYSFIYSYDNKLTNFIEKEIKGEKSDYIKTE